MDPYEMVEVTVHDLYKCKSFWVNGDQRLTNLMNSGERRAFAYKTGGDYVGGCAISIRSNEYGKYGHFSYFSVRSDLRNNGIGSRILDFAVDYLEKLGIQTMRLNVYKDNPDAIRLYERNGFTYAEDLSPEKIAMIKKL